MMSGQRVIVATKNKDKFLTASHCFQGSPYTLVQSDIDLPEIQDDDVRKIATFSAQWASEQLQEPVVVTDVGYFISAVGGFPGPFIKYVNNWFSPDDYLRLLDGAQDRRVAIKECLAFASPGLPVHLIEGEAHGTLAKSYTKQSYTPINTLFIPDGFDRTEAEIDINEMVTFWNSQFNTWPRLLQHLSK